MTATPRARNEFQYWVSQSMAVRPSTIPGAGKGAFWNGSETLPPGRVIGIYAGLRYKTDDDVPDKNLTYALGLADGTVVCARNERFANWTRFINDSRGTRNKANVEFTPRGDVKTTAAIPPGQELFVKYGHSYWRDRGTD